MGVVLLKFKNKALDTKALLEYLFLVCFTEIILGQCKISK